MAIRPRPHRILPEQLAIFRRRGGRDEGKTGGRKVVQNGLERCREFQPHLIGREHSGAGTGADLRQGL